MNREIEECRSGSPDEVKRNPGGFVRSPDYGFWPSSGIRLLFIACTVLILGCNARESTEEVFLNNLRNEIPMAGAANINLDFGNMAKWDEACFDRNGGVRIKLIESNKIIQNLHLEFRDVFIDEGYVAMSPSGRCFARNYQFQVERVSANGGLVFVIRANK